MVPETAPFADGAAYNLRTAQWTAISNAPVGLRHAAVSVVDVSYATHRKPSTFPQTLGEVEGRLGTVQILEGQILRIHTAMGQRDEVIAPDARHWTSAPWTQIQDSVAHTQQHFVDTLRLAGEFETSARYSLQTYALAEAAYQSAASGRVVSIAALLNGV